MPAIIQLLARVVASFSVGWLASDAKDKFFPSNNESNNPIENFLGIKTLILIGMALFGFYIVSKNNN